MKKDRLNELLDKLHMSSKTFAKIAGVNSQTVRYFLRGISKPHHATMQKIDQTYNSLMLIMKSDQPIASVPEDIAKMVTTKEDALATINEIAHLFDLYILDISADVIDYLTAISVLTKARSKDNPVGWKAQVAIALSRYVKQIEEAIK